MYIIKQKSDILFDSQHFNFLSKLQKLFITLECDSLIALIRLSFTNKNVENNIKRGNPRLKQAKTILF